MQLQQNTLAAIARVHTVVQSVALQCILFNNAPSLAMAVDTYCQDITARNQNLRFASWTMHGQVMVRLDCR